MPTLLNILTFGYLFGILNLSLGHIFDYSGKLSIIARILQFLGMVILGICFLTFFAISYLDEFGNWSLALPAKTIILSILYLAIALLLLVGTFLLAKKFFAGNPLAIHTSHYFVLYHEDRSISRKKFLRDHYLVLCTANNRTEKIKIQINWLAAKRLKNTDLALFSIAEIEHYGTTGLSRSIILINPTNNTKVLIAK